MSQEGWTLEEEGLFTRLLRHAGRSIYHGRICITDSVGYTPEQLSALCECDPKKLPFLMASLEAKNRVKIDQKTGIVEIINWKKFQTQYDKRKNYVKVYRASVQPKCTGGEVRSKKKEEDLICKHTLLEAGSKDTPPVTAGPPLIKEYLQSKEVTIPPLQQVKSVYADYSPVLWRSIGIRAKANDHFEQLLITGHKPEDIINCIKSHPNEKPWEIKPVKEYVDALGYKMGIKLAPHYVNGKEVK
jgi:hypothetical protein